MVNPMNMLRKAFMIPRYQVMNQEQTIVQEEIKINLKKSDLGEITTWYQKQRPPALLHSTYFQVSGRFGGLTPLQRCSVAICLNLFIGLSTFKNISCLKVTTFLRQCTDIRLCLRSNCSQFISVCDVCGYQNSTGWRQWTILT